MKAINYIQFKSPLHGDVQNKVPNIQQKTNQSFNDVINNEQTTNQLKVSKHAFIDSKSAIYISMISNGNTLRIKCLKQNLKASMIPLF